ncbi:MAG TPA: exopolyphosphatase [Lutibacter sp.]|nr:exopolyphosphatase [Lutibacter sp.]
MKVIKYAAIDVGSNGVRLLISNIILKNGKAPIFNKSALVRVPIRLGADTFKKGKISDSSLKRMIKAMKAFKLLMDVHKVENFRACATSAIREASNSQFIVDEIEKKSKVKIDIIDGKTEAEIIASTDLYKVIEERNNYLYVDVGGGSTEFTFFSKGEQVSSKSFKIGSVRSFGSKETYKQTKKLAKDWIKEEVKKYDKLIIIGSGGNINKIFKLSGTKIGKPLTRCYLQQEFKALKKLTYEERIREIGLNPDRADVIVPALKIYLATMKWSKSDSIIVPQIGLADGIVKTLFAKDNS